MSRERAAPASEAQNVTVAVGNVYGDNAISAGGGGEFDGVVESDDGGWVVGGRTE
jgi:hypothetical protein